MGDHPASSSLPELTVALAASGYDRGFLTEMMAMRVQNLMRAIHDGQFNSLPEIVARGDQAQASTVLTSVNGIGPTVAKTAWMSLTTP